jgi:murein DD-endopeptidase MepM/ murein hydrolase activator NlpD
MPDMRVPVRDTRRLEGNYVFLNCSGLGVLLAHLRAGSIVVAPGSTVARGQVLGQVGNSGNSTEPHLHIHAQRLSEATDLLAGAPVYLTLGGRFPARNDRLVKPATAPPSQ